MIDDRTVIDNQELHPWFNADEKRVLQKLGIASSEHAQAELADDLAVIQNQIDNITVSPVAFSTTATAAQTAFTVNGVATDQGELVLVFKNGIRLRPTFDYTVAFTLDPEVTTITLVSPAADGDIISGVIYNIAVDTVGAIDVQARQDIADLAAATPDNLTDLLDVTITSPTVGQVLKYNGTVWINDADGGGGGGTISLDDLTDVVITSPSTGQVLKYNGSAWVNDTDSTGGGSGATNLSVTRTTTTVTVESDTGTDASLPAATTSLAGVMTSSDKTKLDGIATGATANSSDSTLLNRANHTGTQALSTLSQSGAATGQVATWNGSAWAPATPSGGGGSGTVTSVAFTTSDSSLSVSGSPVTTSGTITVTLNTVPVNKGGTGATTASGARANLGLGTAATANTGDFAAASHTHDASAITSGTFVGSRLASGLATDGRFVGVAAGITTWLNITAGDILSGTFADARIPNLDASKTTTGQFADARRGVFVQSATPTGVTGGVWIW